MSERFGERIDNHFYSNDRVYIKLINLLILLAGAGALATISYSGYKDYNKDYILIRYFSELSYWELFFYDWLPYVLNLTVAVLLAFNILTKKLMDTRQMKGLSKIEFRIAKIEYERLIDQILLVAGILAYFTFPSMEGKISLMKDNWLEIIRVPFFLSNIMLALCFFIVMPKLKEQCMDFDKSDVK